MVSVLWIFTKYGFYSVVVDRYTSARGEDGKPLMAWRGRCWAHLGRLQQLALKLFGAAGEILQTSHTDYGYRLLLSHTQTKAVMSHLLDEIDYHNFQDEVKKANDGPDPADEAYQDCVRKVWLVGATMQDALAPVRLPSLSKMVKHEGVKNATSRPAKTSGRSLKKPKK